jgi:thiosulfate/3-mercaptopyruvate sulfurtransferase
MKLKLQLLILFLTFSFLNADNLRIEINQLSKNISDYKIIDVRLKTSYADGHIKGAVNFPIALTYDNKKINGKLIEPNKMQNILRELGLDVNDKVVIYDSGTFFNAARLFWSLEVYGFKDVKLLNAGYDEWDSLDLPISKQTPTPKKSNYIASIDNKRLATKFLTQIATKSPSQIIVDARVYNAFIGKESNAQRFGHIPKAINIPAKHNFTTKDNIQRLKDLKELKTIYKHVNKDKKIILYCDVGRVSSSNYFALRELGYNVANYDASWKEWGNDFNLPIEK